MRYNFYYYDDYGYKEITRYIAFIERFRLYFDEHWSPDLLKVRINYE